MLKHIIFISKFIKITILILIIVILRILFDEIRFYNKAEMFYKQKYILEAVDYYEYSINAYIPFSPIAKKAINKMLKIGKNFEKNKEYKKALYVYESLRSAFLQARSFYIPHKKLVKKLDYKVASLKAKILIVESKCNNYEICKKHQLEILQSYKNDISTFWSFLSCLSFVLWIFTVILGIFTKSINNKKIFFISSIIFFIIWLFGLYMA